MCMLLRNDKFARCEYSKYAIVSSLSFGRLLCLVDVTASFQHAWLMRVHQRRVFKGSHGKSYFLRIIT